MTITHIVAFKLAEDSNVENLKTRMLALKDSCLSKEGKPYIVSFVGGKQTSPEGKDHGINYVFSIEFANENDRQWYLYDDPVHNAFKDAVPSLGVLEVIVLDYTAGEW